MLGEGFLLSFDMRRILGYRPRVAARMRGLDSLRLNPERVIAMTDLVAYQRAPSPSRAFMPVKPPRRRVKFPETWIWAESTVA